SDLSYPRYSSRRDLAPRRRLGQPLRMAIAWPPLVRADRRQRDQRARPGREPRLGDKAKRGVDRLAGRARRVAEEVLPCGPIVAVGIGRRRGLETRPGKDEPPCL